jgi:hypothetical protein
LRPGSGAKSRFFRLATRRHREREVMALGRPVKL